MKKVSNRLLGMLFVLLFASTANATTITTTFAEFSSPYHESGTYYDKYKVGDFSFDLLGEEILSATISGTWGNSANPTTAYNLLFMDDQEIANTDNYTPSPGGAHFTKWTFTFTDFSIFEDGLVNFFAIQTSMGSIRLDETTLTIETASSPVPVPATIVLLGFGLAGLMGAKRQKVKE